MRPRRPSLGFIGVGVGVDDGVSVGVGDSVSVVFGEDAAYALRRSIGVIVGIFGEELTDDFFAVG